MAPSSVPTTKICGNAGQKSKQSPVARERRVDDPLPVDDSPSPSAPESRFSVNSCKRQRICLQAAKIRVHVIVLCPVYVKPSASFSRAKGLNTKREI